jgi:NADH dehydrogenase [ubiquinone] 1 alpha subcomplex assembly factor 3
MYIARERMEKMAAARAADAQEADERAQAQAAWFTAPLHDTTSGSGGGGGDGGQPDVIVSEPMVKTFIGGIADGVIQVNGVNMRSAVMVFPNFMTLWRPESFRDVTVESLQMLRYLAEEPELVLFGTGAQTEQLPRDILVFMERHQLKHEVRSTFDACATFNILNEEERRVVGCMLPWREADEHQDYKY